MQVAPRVIHFQTSRKEVEVICKNFDLPIDYYAQMYTGNSGEAFGGDHWIIDDKYQSIEQQKAADFLDNAIKKCFDSRTIRSLTSHLNSLQFRDERAIKDKNTTN